MFHFGGGGRCTNKATGWTVRGLNPTRNQIFFFSPKRRDWSIGSNPASYLVRNLVFYPGVEQPGREVNLSPQSSADPKNEVYLLLPPVCAFTAWTRKTLSFAYSRWNLLLGPLSAGSRAAGYESVACKFIYVCSTTNVIERIAFSPSGLSCAFSLGCSHTNLIRSSCVKLYSSCVFGWYTC